MSKSFSYVLHKMLVCLLSGYDDFLFILQDKLHELNPTEACKLSRDAGVAQRTLHKR